MKLTLMVIVMFAGIAGVVNCTMIGAKQDYQDNSPEDLPMKGRMPSLAHAKTWINSEPLADDALRGKVVVVDFWTYTCINWRRQLPYLREWSKKYKDQGLIVIGVHTPEFGFEKDLDNVRSAVKEIGIDYPIVLDSEYSIWNDFANRYWPALYFVDARGNIRHEMFGEGEYEKSERVIQQLLKENGRTIDQSLVAIDPRGEEVQADWKDLRSQENYLGYSRTENFSSPGGAALDKSRSYKFPSSFGLNDWALAGEWTFGREWTRLDSKTGNVKLRFHARDINLVAGPAAKGSTIRFRVSIDGKPPGESHGVDIDADGNGKIGASKMYQLLRQTSSIADRDFEIEFLDPGVELFAFTFG